VLYTDALAGGDVCNGEGIAQWVAILGAFDFAAPSRSCSHIHRNTPLRPARTDVSGARRRSPEYSRRPARSGTAAARLEIT